MGYLDLDADSKNSYSLPVPEAININVRLLSDDENFEIIPETKYQQIPLHNHQKMLLL